MNAPRFRKVCDIPVASQDQLGALRNYLMKHKVHHKTTTFTKRGFVRYFVHENDLCFAKSAANGPERLREKAGLAGTGNSVSPDAPAEPEAKQ